MGGRLSNNGNNYGILIRPALSNPKKIASNSGKHRISNTKKSLCRVNSVIYIWPFALKIFLVIENHFGAAFERGDLAKVCNFGSILCKICDGWLRAGRAGLSNNGNPSSLITGIIIVIDQLCNNGRK